LKKFQQDHVFRTYANIDSSGGTNEIIIVYKRDLGGTETQLFSGSTEI
jgi:hypothetical protein